MNNIRIDWIDLTKGIAIFLMVCGHTSIPLPISNWIWSFHMPLFFIISGILFNATKYPNFNLFIKKRGGNSNNTLYYILTYHFINNSRPNITRMVI